MKCDQNLNMQKAKYYVRKIMSVATYSDSLSINNHLLISNFFCFTIKN